MIRTLNLNRRLTSILENAYNIGYEREANAIWQASFNLPLNDSKVEKVKQLEYVEIVDDLTDEYIGLFRIMPKLTRKNSEANYVQFQCEHVLSTLLDSSLFQYHQLSNYTTEYVLQYLLDQQNHKHWKLGRIEFTRYFHYSWENENVLSALLSVPKPFNEHYIWTWDTKSYPWTLNLVKPEVLPTARIKEGYNLQTLEIEENPMSQFNRIYPLGAGEGVNQLTIRDVNNGVPYLEDRNPGEEIREVIWPDQRYTNPNTLKADAKTLLDKWKIPQVIWKATATEVSSITGLEIDKLKEGKVVRLDIADIQTVDLRIMKEKKSDIKGDPGNVDLEIGNVIDDLGATNADLERRLQINELYSQGATNILNFTYQDNSDANTPATIPFYLDDDVVNVNTIELTFRTKKFRAYSQATHGGGSIVKSTGGGGGIVKSTGGGGSIVKSTGGGGGIVKSTGGGGSIVKSTGGGGGTTRSTTSGGGNVYSSSSGGGVAKSTESGGGDIRTSTSGGGGTRTSNQYCGGTVVCETMTGETNGDGMHRHVLPGQLLNHTHSIQIPAHTHNISILAHRHEMEIPNHNHSVNIPNHNHSVNIPNHNHSVTIPEHTHEIDLPNHIHEIELPDHTHEIDLPNHIHEIELPDHTHEVKHEIIELNTMPSKVTIKVDGNVVPHTDTSGDRINLADYMSKDSNGKITRGRHEVTIQPNGLARIEADLICRVFIQSQLGQSL